jgi:uroporphyrinogen decarboxylase
VTLQPVERLGVDAAILFADITLPFEGLGFPFEIREGVGPVVFEPISSADDVARLRPFDPEEWVAPLLEAIRIVRRRSPVPLIGFAGAPFTLASYLVEGGPTRTFAKVKTLMHAEPNSWEELMRRLVDATIAYLRAQATAGAQALQVFDSWAGALAPIDYRAYVEQHRRRLFASLPPVVPTIHFGTGTAGILPFMAEAGGDVMGVDWRIDLDRAREAIGGRPVQGNLDPTVAAGPWQAAGAEARAILAAVGGRPGHVFNLGHGVLPHTPVENLQRLVELVHEWPLVEQGARR